MLDYLGIGVVDQVNLVPDLLTIRDRFKEDPGLLIIVSEDDENILTLSFLFTPRIGEKTDGRVEIMSRQHVDRTYYLIKSKSTRFRESIAVMDHLRLSGRYFFTVERAERLVFPAQSNARYIYAPSSARVEPALRIAMSQAQHVFSMGPPRGVYWPGIHLYTLCDLINSKAFYTNYRHRFCL